MGKGKPRHNPEKWPYRFGTWCTNCEEIESDGRIRLYCEAGYDTKICQGNPHKCKKALYARLASRSDRRKNIDDGLI